MKKHFIALLTFLTFLGIGSIVPATAQDTNSNNIDIRLYRLACGHMSGSNKNFWSDTQAYPPDATIELTVSCYLIKHGDKWLLWDTGLPPSFVDSTGEPGPRDFYAKKTLTAQLAEIGLTPDDIDYVGLSHAHLDHAGHVNMFANSTLIIQEAAFNAVFSDDPPEGVMPKLLSAFKDGKNVKLVNGDYDIFGDGSVVTLFTPGHTPGHQALLVRLPQAGPVILSGDVAHTTENWKTNQVPDINTNRAKSLASLNRLKRLVHNLDALLIIQHEPSDIDKLPKFPNYLK